LEDRPILAFDDLCVDIARQRVMRGGQPLDVAGLSFQLLRYLLQQGDRVVGFDELIEHVWAPAVVNEETVTQRIKLLRQALGDDGRNPRYIRSVRGRGYQLCGVPREIAADHVVEKARTPPPSQARRAALIVLSACALGFGAWATHAYHTASSGGSTSERGSNTAPDELLQRAKYYAGIGQTENNERAITLYEDALHIHPDDIAASIGLSRALSARMCLYNGGPEAAARAQQLAEAVIARAPRDSRGHDALAYAFDCRGDLDAAIGAYEAAIALDPAARVDSLGSVANLYMVEGRLADALAANVAVEKTGMKLRFLDLQIARNLDLLGFSSEAEQRYAKLFKLYPDNVFGNVAYPRFLFAQGRYAEAESALAEARQRPPHPDLFLLAGEIALLRGDRARAQEAFAQAAALRPHQSLPQTLAHAYAAPVDAGWLAAQAQARASEAATGAGDEWLEVAVLRLAGSHRAGAIDALRRAVAGGFRDRAWLQNTPLFRPLADDPAFAGIVDAISRAVAQERATVLAAAWLPADLVNAKAAAAAR
jgi:DNA-binding winged helix-turn-helix (wHTH) protein/Tfp pilus assembly protein PilF